MSNLIDDSGSDVMGHYTGESPKLEGLSRKPFAPSLSDNTDTETVMVYLPRDPKQSIWRDRRKKCLKKKKP